MSLPSPEITWFILGIIFLVLEMIMPGFVIFFFGVGAWLTSLVLLFVPLNLNVQLIIFLVTSLVCLFALRKYIQRTFLGNKQDDEIDSVLASGGEQAIVTEAIIPPAQGKVKYSGTNWTAISETEIAEGEVVTIQSQDGLLMKVRKVE